jgi:hypothetical protein
MRASTLIVGLTALSGVALAWAPYVNTVVESSTITVVSCGPEVSSCAGRTTRLVLLSLIPLFLDLLQDLHDHRPHHASPGLNWTRWRGDGCFSSIAQKHSLCTTEQYNNTC